MRAERWYLYEFEARDGRTKFTVGPNHRPPSGDELMLLTHTSRYQTEPDGVGLVRSEVEKLRDVLSDWLENGWPGVRISRPVVSDNSEGESSG